MTKKEKVEVPADSSDHSDDDSDVADVTDDDSEGEGEDTVTVEQEVTNAERLNENKPIWTRSPDDLTEQDYIDFYKMFSKDELDPIGYTHFKVRGRMGSQTPSDASDLNTPLAVPASGREAGFTVRRKASSTSSPSCTSRANRHPTSGSVARKVSAT